MIHSSNFFERLIEFAQSQGIMNANQLAKHLGYGSSEKISRLGRDKNSKPGFDLLVDLANMFENAPLYWLITGKRASVKSYFSAEQNADLEVNDPLGDYTRLPPKHSLSPEYRENVTNSVDMNPLFQNLLDEKDRVIETLKELIDAQKDTITLLREKESK